MSAPIYSAVNANYFEQLLLTNNFQEIDGYTIDALIDPALDTTAGVIGEASITDTNEEASITTINQETSTAIFKVNTEGEHSAITDRTPETVKRWYAKLIITKKGEFQYTCDIDGCNSCFIQKDKALVRKFYIRHLLEFAKRLWIKGKRRDSALLMNENNTELELPDTIESIKLAIEAEYVLFEIHAKAHLKVHAKEVNHKLPLKEIKARKLYKRSFKKYKDQVRVSNRKLKIRKDLKKNKDLVNLDAKALEILVMKKYSEKFGNK